MHDGSHYFDYTYYFEDLIFILFLMILKLFFVLPCSWTVDTFFRDSEIAKLLQLGIHREVAEDELMDTTSRKQSYNFDNEISKRKKIQDDDIIDVEADKTQLK